MFNIQYETWKNICKQYFDLKLGSQSAYLQWFPFTKLSDEDKISDTEIDRILTVEKPMYETIVFRRSKIEQFFPAGMTGKEIEEKLYSWMLRYQKEWQSRLEKEQER